MPSLQSLRQQLAQALYPDLASIAPQHRERAMQRARSESFDFLEVCGIVTAIGVVTLLTRVGLKDPTLADRLSTAVALFIVAAPQLLVLAGPFLVRRTRRGLRAFLDEERRPRSH